MNRISGPLLDRIDMHIEVESIPAERLSDTALSEDSASIRRRVEAAREVQRARYSDQGSFAFGKAGSAQGRTDDASNQRFEARHPSGIHCNAELNARTLANVCKLTPSARELLTASTEKMKLSNRAYTRILKVARTICDLDGIDLIGDEQVAEAVQYRTLDRKYWG